MVWLIPFLLRAKSIAFVKDAFIPKGGNSDAPSLQADEFTSIGLIDKKKITCI